MLRPHFIDKPPGISRLRGLPRSAGISREQNLHRESIVRPLAYGQAWVRCSSNLASDEFQLNPFRQLQIENPSVTNGQTRTCSKNIPLISNDLHKFAKIFFSLRHYFWPSRASFFVPTSSAPTSYRPTLFPIELPYIWRDKFYSPAAPGAANRKSKYESPSSHSAIQKQPSVNLYRTGSLFLTS